MQRVLEMMRDALAMTWEAASPYLASVPAWAWAAIVSGALALTALRVLRPPRTSSTEPKLMLSRAELTPLGEAGGGYRLVAAFSNLHHEPIQLLRIAAAGADRQQAVVESTALVTARRAVELEADLDIGGGGRGRLDLYVYVPSSSARAWRLRVPLIWEPWSRRYKATPLQQRLTPVSRLPEPPPRGRSAPADTPPEPVRDGARMGFPDDF